jgi:hypothetical protein
MPSKMEHAQLISMIQWTGLADGMMEPMMNRLTQAPTFAHR